MIPTGNEVVSLMTNNSNHTTILDSDRDAVLKCLDQDSDVRIERQVSTAVIRLASFVFSNTFKPSFNKGQRLLNENFPKFELEDDAYPIDLLPRILYHQGSCSNYVKGAEQLTYLSVLYDKYGCKESLGTRIPT